MSTGSILASIRKWSPSTRWSVTALSANIPAHGKTPLLKKLGLIAMLLGILAAIGLGILKKMQLSEPDPKLTPAPLTEIEKEFKIASDRLDEFRDASSVAEKMSFVRVPITQMVDYPPLVERMNEYYNHNTLNAHFPSLDRASGTIVEQGESEFFRIAMENKRVNYIPLLREIRRWICAGLG